MTANEIRQLVARRIRDNLKRLSLNTKSASKEILGLLKKTRLDISESLKGVSRFRMAYYRSMLREVDSKITFFETKMNNVLTGYQTISFKDGSTLSGKILTELKIIPDMPIITNKVLIASLSSSADLVKNLTASMRDDIARSLRRSILTGENNFEAARNIDKIIGISKKKGYMNRSDIITRTEINRVYSLSRQSSDEEAVKKVPELKKQWWTARDERVRPLYKGKIFPSRTKWNHSEVHGQIKDVNEPFIVSGERLMEPRDPAGSPGNVINCRCQSIPYMEEWGLT